MSGLDLAQPAPPLPPGEGHHHRERHPGRPGDCEENAVGRNRTLDCPCSQLRHDSGLYALVDSW
jgi:hypothetical protein